MHVVLWIGQTVLALLFLPSGWIEATTPATEIVRSIPPLAILPVPLIRFIGISELAGVIGMILPAATRIYPKLTPWAAVGLATIMVLAVGFHARTGTPEDIPFNLAAAGLAAFVAWGRFKAVPIQPRW